MLVGLGLVSAARSPRRDVLFVTLGFLLFHVSLHLVFGEVVFLYVLHGLPSFAMLIGFALAGPLRIPAALFAAGFILLGAPHNTARFVESAELAAELVRRRMAG
ncbi:MAG: hypothetical protein RML45_11045 [Acetobacteraceae bacterium]|nr:hypothetical protein [Acetobacteraceae bacterium]